MRSLARIALCLLVLVAAAWLPRPDGVAAALRAQIEAVMREPEYKHAHWGILVVDRAAGETLYEWNADKLFVPASTTKLFSVAAALDEFGADHCFETPIYQRGEVDAAGQLRGDLILVASGDLSFGGRTDPNGRIAFKDSDHTYANGNLTAELTDPDPLQGLEALARQVAARGIRRVRGDVLIDDRLFDKSEGTGSGPARLTPIMINDNLIDIVVTPGAPGAPAAIRTRPETIAYRVDGWVDTVAADGETRIEVRSAGAGRLVVRGEIAAERKPVVRVVEVDDAAAFARCLLIESLRRAGVVVDASPLQANDASRLPDDGYASMQRVAAFKSPPFRESARLILKVSHNLQASTLPLLLAARHGERTLGQGLRRQQQFLSRVGVDAETISFGGGAGGSRADYTTPRATVQLLRHMATRPDFESYRTALPILGVDGTLASSVASDSSARGQVYAKTGTLFWHNTMNDRFIVTSKALAGYGTTASGREVAFAMFVNNTHIAKAGETSREGRTLGRLCEIICREL